MCVIKFVLSLVVLVDVIYAAKLSVEETDKKGCSQPESVKNGQFYLTSPTSVEYLCRPGYVMLGEATRDCMEDGEWTGKAPICIGSKCTSPGYLEKGTSIYSYEGGYITFQCEPGYKLKGKDTLICEGDSWNGRMPQCVERDTSDGADVSMPDDEHRDSLEKSDYTCITEGKKVSPPQVENSFMDISWAVYNRQARLYAVYRCRWGYTSKSSQRTTLYCQNGKWVGEKPFCQPVGKGSDGSYIKDSPKGNSRDWSHKDWLKQSDYTCMKQKGVQPPIVYNAKDVARVEVINGYPRLYVEYKCLAGYKLAGKERYMYCGEGTWVGELPRCKQINKSKAGGLYLRIDE